MQMPKFISRRKTTSSASVPVNTAAYGYVLDCRIESGVHLYYEIHRDGNVDHITEPIKGMALVSAAYAPSGKPDDDTADDYRFNLPKKMTASQASSYIQRELGLFHKLRSVVIQSPGSVAYSVVEGKVPPKDKILPFSLPLEHLMAGDNLIPPCVTGVLFGESDLLILMAYPGNGRVFVQTSVSPDNLAEIITSFAAANSINVDIEAIPLYTGVEFITALSNTPAYPFDTDVMGLPVSSVVNGILAISVAALLISAGAYLYLYSQMQKVQLATQFLIRESQSVLANMRDRIGSNPTALSAALAVNYPLLIQHATQLWVKGATVASDASHSQETHTVILPLREKSVVISDAQIRQMIQKTDLPTGCTFTGFTIPGAVNVIKASYACVYAASPIAVLGGDNETK
ncbi:MAG: hypothetical protein ACYCSS_00900 [Sulfuriferula sp.]